MRKFYISLETVIISRLSDQQSLKPTNDPTGMASIAPRLFGNYSRPASILSSCFKKHHRHQGCQMLQVKHKLNVSLEIMLSFTCMFRRDLIDLRKI